VDLEPEAAEIASRYFSTVTVSMLTLVQFVCLDSIAGIVEPLVRSRPSLALYFMTAIMFIGIVLMNLITAVIINSSLEAAQEDKTVRMLQAKSKRERMVKDIRALLVRLDSDISGTVCREEFLNLTDDHKRLLQECLPNMEPAIIFEVLDVDNIGSLTIDEFVDGMLNLVQTGISPQMKRMQVQVESTHKQLHDLLTFQLELFKHLGLDTPRLLHSCRHLRTVRTRAGNSSGSAVSITRAEQVSVGDPLPDLNPDGESCRTQSLSGVGCANDSSERSLIYTCNQKDYQNVCNSDWVKLQTSMDALMKRLNVEATRASQRQSHMLINSTLADQAQASTSHTFPVTPRLKVVLRSETYIDTDQASSPHSLLSCL
jgi:Ca2+-binding EF-hand superfamily protein